MGQAKNRKAEIDALKQNGPKTSFGLIDVMFQFGDGDWADENRNALVSQCLDQIIERLPFITDNLARGKTTECAGVEVGFDRNRMTKLPNYHIVIQDPRFILAIQEFKTELARNSQARLLNCGFMATRGGAKEITPFFAYMGKTTNIVVTKGGIGHQIQFIPAETVAKYDCDPANPEQAAKQMADFVA
jgi:hypothetical protein